MQFSSEMSVELIQSCGEDVILAGAAKVSQGADRARALLAEEEKIGGLLKTLMTMRHGTPFEHGFMTFCIDAPIMVWREFHRHRVGFSYNEESGRYKEMRPKFYVPGPNRPMKPVKDFKPMRPEFEPLGETEYALLRSMLESTHAQAWDSYQALLGCGVAKEVARSVLGVGIYSSCWVSCNPRSLMHFLALRVKSEQSQRVSYPQWEINQVALQMEAIFGELFPRTYGLYCESGRMAP